MYIYTCVYTYIYRYIYTHIFSFRFVSMLGYYKMLNIVSCAIQYGPDIF